MTRYKIILGVFVYFAVACLRISQVAAVEPKKIQTVEEACPGLATHVLETAKMIEMGKGILLKADGIDIQESHLKQIVEKSEPPIRSQLKKNLFFLLEQEVMKRVMVREVQRAGITMKSPAEEAQAIQSYLNRVVQDVSVSDEEAKNFYNENKEMVGGAPFDQVKDSIQQVLLQQKRVGAVESLIQDLIRRADIRINRDWVKAQNDLAMDNPVDKARMSGKPTMVEFGSTGCTPCDMMQPILDKLRKNYSDRLNVVFVHVGENQILGARFGIRSIPVQAFYNKNGKEVFRHVGFYAEAEVLKQLAKLGVN